MLSVKLSRLISYKEEVNQHGSCQKKRICNIHLVFLSATRYMYLQSFDQREVILNFSGENVMFVSLNILSMSLALSWNVYS